jgi:energy-coupling factor transport system permease protein
LSALVEYIPGDSFFHRLDPRSKILFMLLVSSLVFFIRSLWLAAAVLLALLFLWTLTRLPFSFLGQIGAAMAGIASIIFVAQALFYPGETILVRPIIPEFVPLIGGIGRITLDGILFALLLTMRLLSMTVVLPLVTMTTPIHRFTLGLVRMGLPYRWAYTMTTALNLIPILQAEANAIAEAQRLRAFSVFEKGRLLEKLRAYPALATPLIIGAMRRAQLIAVAMDSRAFGATKDRTYIEDIHMRVRDWVFILCTVLCVLGAAVASVAWN